MQPIFSRSSSKTRRSSGGAGSRRRPSVGWKALSFAFSMDGIEPTDSEAADAVLTFLRHLREYNAAMEADVTLLGSPNGRQLCQFLEGVRAAVGIQRMFAILKATPGLFTRRFIDGAMVLGSAVFQSDEGFEVRVRRRIGDLSTAAEVSWLPLLHAYLALSDARNGKLTTYDRPMVGRIHASCEQGWQGCSDPRCLLDKDTVIIRNAHAHPANLQIDVVSETVTFLGKHSVGPLSDEELRVKSEQMMAKLFTAFLALEFAVLQEVFLVLDQRGWTLSPGQQLLPLGSPSTE